MDHLFATRPPTTTETALMANQNRDDFRHGAIVAIPANWGQALFVVDNTRAHADGTLAVLSAYRRGDGSIAPFRSIYGAAHPTDVIKVCPQCLIPDPLNLHLLGCDNARDTDSEAVTRAREAYLDALVTAGQTDLADLLRDLRPRTYEPEAADGETDTEQVVDLYGVSISAVPTLNGLLIHLNTDDLPAEQAPLLLEVDGDDVGTFREAVPRPSPRPREVPKAPADLDHPLDLDTVVAELGTLGISAVVEHTGGGVATVYAGEPQQRGDGYSVFDERPVLAGPGTFAGPGWTQGRAYREEFSVSLNDEGLSPSYPAPAGATEADIARMIAHVLAGDQPLVGDGDDVTVPPYTAPA